MFRDTFLYRSPRQTHENRLNRESDLFIFYLFVVPAYVVRGIPLLFDVFAGKGVLRTKL